MTARTPGRAPLDVMQVPLWGIHLIEASAGTGKTFTITSLVLRFLVEEERPIESILAVTFTNAATAELKERVAARIAVALSVLRDEIPAGTDVVCQALRQRPDRSKAVRLLERAEADVDRAGIFTIHGFAAKMLADHSLSSGARVDAELVGDQRALVLDLVTDFWSNQVATLPSTLFRQVGGTAFFRSLLKVGLVKAGALDVPMVEVQSGLDLPTEQAALERSFAFARTAFFEQGQELLELLVHSPALDRNKMRPPSLHADFEDHALYFGRGDPFVGHPASLRFTQKKVQSSVKKGKSAPQHPLLTILGELREQYERVELAAAQFADSLRFRLCDHIDSNLRQEHERERSQSFDGLLADLRTALCSGGMESELGRQIRAAYPVALIDEFQDTDPVQYEIFGQIYRNSSDRSPSALFLIGDPKQSIYAFRGADIFTYLRAGHDARSGVWTLTTSYRASPRLVAAQNALFQDSRQPFGMEGIVYEPVTPRPGAEDVLCDTAGRALPGLHVAVCEQKEPDFLWLTAQEIARFLSGGHRLSGRVVLPSDLAVLTRTNQQAQQIQTRLRELDIPAVMHGDRSVFEAPEAIELRRILRALSEPGNRTLSRTALATRMIGLHSDELASIEDSHEELERWMGRLARWGALFKTRGIAPAIEKLSLDVDLVARTLAQRDGERRMTNFRHLFELLHEAETVQHLGVAGLLRWFEGAIADPSGHAMAAEARQLRLESDADAVTLTTAHKSKGLEYNIVFLPMLGAGDLPFVDEAYRYFDEAKGQCRLEVRGRSTRGESSTIHDLEVAQESLRLGYVALTRARHHIFALLGLGKRFSSLGYFLGEREAPGGGGLEQSLGYLKSVSPETRKAALGRVCAASQGACAWSVVSPDPGPRYHDNEPLLRLEPPPPAPLLTERERTSSFSAMTRHNLVSRAARDGRDVDEGIDDAGVLPGDGSVRVPSQERSSLADFPRGARPGDALHAMFEHCPFGETEERKREIAERQLQLRGFASPHIEAGARCLLDVLGTPLRSFRAGSPIVLGRLEPRSCVPEMEFSLPVGLPRVKRISGEPNRLSSARLAQALGARRRAPHEAHAPLVQLRDEGEESSQASPKEAGHCLSPRYLDAVARLDFEAWSGFLRGFIDLVYEHEGRIYALDYKSNHLGDNYNDYHEGALLRSMEEHHYLLQALIYCVALHRYARARIPDYRYEDHFGGMHYLFLRGISPSRSTGIYWMRPSERQVVALDRLFANPTSDSEQGGAA